MLIIDRVNIGMRFVPVRTSEFWSKRTERFDDGLVERIYELHDHHQRMSQWLRSVYHAVEHGTEFPPVPEFLEEKKDAQEKAPRKQRKVKGSDTSEA